MQLSKINKACINKFIRVFCGEEGIVSYIANNKRYKGKFILLFRSLKSTNEITFRNDCKFIYLF